MNAISIKIKEGHKLDGEGESLGSDVNGESYTFWKSSGQMEVPMDFAIKLELERPQRYEIVDRNLAKKLFEGMKIPLSKELKEIEQPKPSEKPKVIVEKEDITLKRLDDMTKDDINDWAARRDYDADHYDRKDVMIKKLIKQIEQRTGKKVN